MQTAAMLLAGQALPAPDKFEQGLRREALRQLCALRERILERLGNPQTDEETLPGYWQSELRALDHFAASHGYDLKTGPGQAGASL